MGMHNGKRYRQSLDTINWKAAEDKKAAIEAGEQPEAVTVTEAVERFIADCEARDLGPAQLGKYNLLGKELKGRFGNRELPTLNVDDLRAYRESWEYSPITASKKLERLKTFFRFSQDAGWISKNPAKLLKPPKVKQKPTLPFSKEELEKIEWATEIYHEKYKVAPWYSLKVSAFVQVLRYTGLRIGDAVSLGKDRIHDGKLLLYTQKTQVPVWLPLPDEVLGSLKRVSDFVSGGPYYFWSGNGKLKSAVADWQRTLGKLFKLAGVKGHAHQFRDTFAVSLLQEGVSIETVSVLLGHQNIRVTQRHYNPWVKSRQENLEREVRKVWNRDKS